jgi:pimeloyl-ACP methyl ester carboxylesterase
MRWRSLALASLALSGCGGEDAASTASHQTQAQPLLLCQQGLSDRISEWDKGLFDFCEGIEAQGFHLIWDGDYPAFAAMADQGAYAALFETLDSDGDGDVDASDELFAIHLVGFSWGGMNIAYLADRLERDERVKGARDRVEAMVLFDAYQPFAGHVPIAKNVALSWLYRQSNTGEGDCSSTISLGIGYNGPEPLAKNPNSRCAHYDLDGFLGEIDHCGVILAADEAAVVNVTKKLSYGAWQDHAEGCALE